MNPLDTSSLQNLLQKVCYSLDEALASMAPTDEKLRTALSRVDLQPRDDKLGNLLDEVSRKASLLGAARMRAAFFAGRSSVIQEHIEENAQLPVEDNTFRKIPEPMNVIDLSAGLPQAIEHKGISISINALKASTTQLRVLFHLSGQRISFASGGSNLLDAYTLPLLTGLRVQDQEGKVYELENADDVSAQSYPVQSLSGSLVFTPAPSKETQTLYITIQAVLLTNRGPFLATTSPAQVIEGPWLFEFPLDHTQTNGAE